MNNKAIPAEVASAISSTFKQGLAEAEKQMLQVSNSIMRAMELNLFAELYAIMVPAKKRKQTAKAVKELRKENWEKAIKKANGNELKAMKILAKIS